MSQRPEEQIPAGIYCYGEKGRCPFWRREGDWIYCEHLKEVSADETRPEPETAPQAGYQMQTLSLLWDQVKECGVNDELEPDELPRD